MNQKAILGRFLMEILLWLILPCLFLYFYINQQDVPSSAVVSHLLIIGAFIWLFTLVRLVCAKLGLRRNAQGFTAGVMSLAICSMATYYSLVIIGLNSWNSVPSWGLLKTYAHQIQPLMDTMGLSVTLVAMLAAGLYLTLLGGIWIFLKRFEWIRATAPRMHWRHWTTLSVGAILTTGMIIHQFSQGHWAYAGEPLSLSTFPKRWNFQNHAFDSANVMRLDLAEDRARGAYIATTMEDPANVLLIVVDALRPDHMGLFGYERDTTPYLSDLARTGKIRKSDRIHAICGESTCGLLSMASSRFMHNFSRRMITLQEVLRTHGYLTHMILAGDHTNFYGLRDLYGEVDTYHDGLQSPGFYVNDDRLILDRLEREPHWDGTPTFFQIHLMSAHPLGQRYLDPVHTPQINYGRPDQHFLDRDESRLQSIVNFYDNGVLQTDHTIGNIIEILRSKGYLDKALVIVTADHGEALGEHGLLAHANSVRESVLRIPLVLINYGYQSETPALTNSFASQIDIAPTILKDVVIPIPSTWEGLPLQGTKQRGISYFQQKTEIGFVDIRSEKVSWKYWMDTATGKEFAFDLLTDPGEHNNLVDSIEAAMLAEWRILVAPGRNLISENRSLIKDP